MGITVLASATGSPGVTTTALGLALAWPRDVVLVDADRDAGQSVLAGYLQGHDGTGRGLARLADWEAAARPEKLLEQTVVLTVEDRSCRLLPGFLSPTSAASFEPVWWSFSRGLRGLVDAGQDVIVDAGRVQTGLAPGLVDAADLLLVVVRSTLRSLAGARVHLESLAAIAREGGADRGLIIVGPGRPYGVHEISEQFGWPVVASIAWDPDSAAVLSDGDFHRRFERSLFRKSLRIAAGGVAVHGQGELAWL